MKSAQIWIISSEGSFKYAFSRTFISNFELIFEKCSVKKCIFYTVVFNEIYVQLPKKATFKFRTEIISEWLAHHTVEK